MAKTKFYNMMDGKHPLSRKQEALYDYLLSIINKEVILLVSKDDGRDDNILDVVNGDSFLALNQNGLAVCDTFENENGIEYYVICFYDTSDVKEYEKTTWDISRHPEKGENFDGLGYSDLIIIDDKGNLLKCSQKTSLFESKESARKSIKESINDDCYIYYDDDDGKRNVFCDYVKGITDTRNWFYLNEYIIDAIHIFKNEKQAQKFIDEHLKYFADQDKVVIAEYPQTVSGFFESKESARKSIKEERYNVELSDYSGSIVDEDSFDKKLDAIQWAKDNGRNCYARIWDNEEGKTVKEWKVKSIKESADDILTVKEFCFWGHSGNIVEIWTIDGVLCDTFEVRNVGKSEYKNYEIHGWDCAKNTVIIYIKK